MNDFPTTDQFAIAKRRLMETALDRYLWLQDHFRNASLNIGDEFPTRYAAFYGLRRGKKRAQDGSNSWQEIYFGYLDRLRQRQRNDLPSFAEALRWLSEALPPLKQKGPRPIEASFTSKMLATLDANRPVLDGQVLAHLKLSLPGHNLPMRQRLQKAVETFDSMEARLRAILQHPDWPNLRKEFDLAFVGRSTQKRVTDMKALDLILWASRGGLVAASDFGNTQN